MNRPAESEVEHYALPDGRLLACANAQDVDAVWREIVDGTTYAAAAESLESGDTVVDVGAHVGVTSLYFAGQAADVRVIACEPAPRSVACLRANFDRYLPEAVCVQAAVGARPGVAELTYYPHQTTMTTLHVDDQDDKLNLDTVLRNVGVGVPERASLWEKSRSDPEHLTVPVKTLSELFAEHDVRKVGLLKIDVERAELDVLEGISDSDHRMIRSIVLEVHDIDERLDRVVRLLNPHGYRVAISQSKAFAGGSVHTVLARK